MTIASGRPLLEEAVPSALSSVDRDHFRSLMGSMISGVTVFTSVRADNEPAGMTCSAVCSVSADPPLLLVCVQTPSTTLDAVTESGRFAVNILAVGDNATSELFASRAADKFSQVDWLPSAVIGMPVLTSGVAYVECAVHALREAGDHMIVLGRIVGGETRPERFALGYWRGSYVRPLRMPRRARTAH